MWGQIAGGAVSFQFRCFNQISHIALVKRTSHSLVLLSISLVLAHEVQKLFK